VIPLLFLALLAVILLGVPVLLALGLVSLGGILATPDLVAPLFPQKVFAILDSFSLLALPYFILAGSLMSKGGLSKALVDFAQSLAGRVRGSLAHTSVLSCVAMANVSGSSAAEAAAIGSVTIPAMKERGYQPGLAAGVVAVSSTIGPIIPPSMTMIIYGSMAGVSIGGLFLAGILPGLLIAAALMAMIFALSWLPGYPALRETQVWRGFGHLLRTARRAWVGLLAPVIILGGIFSGVFTATEAGVVACLYALVVSLFILRTVRLRDLPAIFVDAAVTTAMVVGIVGMAGAFGWLLAYFNFNLAVLEFLRGISDSPTTVLMLLLAVMTGLTMFVESLAVLIILVPTIAYIGAFYGFDPLHLGLLVIIATQLGAVTPPVAVLLFVTTSIAETGFEQTVKHSMPFILTLLAMLALLVLYPEIATWLPNLIL